MISALDVAASVAGVQLEVSDARVSLDEARAPFASATLTVPYDPATVDLLDPRLNPRMSLRLEQRWSGSDPLSALSDRFAGKTLADLTAAYGGRIATITTAYGRAWNAFGYSRGTVTRTLDLGLRGRSIDHDAGTVTLALASDEDLLRDYGLLSASPVSPSALTVLDAVVLALSTVLPGATITTTQGAQTITAASAVWQPGVSAWDYLTPLTASAGLRLWCDERRVWHLAAPADVVAPGQVTLAATGSVTAATDTVNRDSDLWADGCVVTYTWTDASNVAHVAYDVAGPSTTTRVHHVKVERPWPRAGEAAARLRKLQGAGRVLSVSAVADFGAYPAMAASLSVPNTPTQTGYVQAVTWSIPSDEMDITTRGLIDTPATAWAFLSAGIGWNKAPVGVKWTDTDPNPAEVP